MKVFIDTSVLVEYLKGNNTEFYEKLLISKHEGLFINQVVFSEYLFYFIAFQTHKSPLSAKMANDISSAFENLNPFDMLPGFIHLEHNSNIAETGLEYMKLHNLLPNDALILATCKYHNISHIATFDADFLLPCSNLGIAVLKAVRDIPEYMPGTAR